MPPPGCRPALEYVKKTESEEEEEKEERRGEGRENQGEKKDSIKLYMCINVCVELGSSVCVHILEF